MTKTLALALLTCVASAQICAAAVFETLSARSPVMRVDWQYPQSLPTRFRNHCSSEYFTGRQYCSNHCGSDYQFFYCSEDSFGCCHLGRGYCDINGVLRCSPN